jgi:hypothetical protein
MRRALALLLVAVLSFPLIAPVLLANTASDLPACCRRDGKHHCAVVDMANQRELPASQSVKALQPRCPLFPKTVLVPAYTKTLLLSVTPRVGAPHLFYLTIAKPDDNRPLIALSGSVRKRGPPTSLNQTN